MSHQNPETSNAVLIALDCQELTSAKNCQQDLSGTEICIDFSKPLYGMSPEEYLEGVRKHNECFYKLKQL
ncbi:hypothetical protein [Flavobacterium cupreum]|nr:hypothetical protein [Flavobacterium cupreum]